MDQYRHLCGFYNSRCILSKTEEEEVKRRWEGMREGLEGEENVTPWEWGVIDQRGTKNSMTA